MPEGQTKRHESERAAVAKFYAAINRNDVSAALEFCDPRIVRVEPEGFPMSGTYRGLDAVREQLLRGRGTWAEGSCEPEEIIVAGDKIIACLHVRVRLKDQAEWLDGRLADAFAFRDGKMVEWHSFAEKQRALDWAGHPRRP